MNTKSNNTPNPGSIEALDQGCTCPRSDNYWGDGIGKDKNGDPQFWTDVKCPLHGGDKEYVYCCSKCGFQSLNVEDRDDHLLQRHKVIPYRKG